MLYLLKSGGDSLKILMVEDEKRFGEAIANILKENHYLVDLTFDGENGLDCALTGIYDIIILDIMLPKRDGLSVLRELRRQNIKVPVILLTAKGQVEDRILGLDSGADDYLVKPFATGELLARLRALSRRPDELVPDGILTLGNIELRTESLSLCGSLCNVELTAKEFQVMELLLNRKGIITSKERIIEKVWGFDAEIDEHCVETYISFLRKKLVLIGASVVIRAIRGAGYLIVERGADGC